MANLKKCPYLHYVPTLSPFARRIVKYYENKEVPRIYERIVDCEVEACGEAVKLHRPDLIFSRHRMRAIDIDDDQARNTEDEADGFSGSGSGAES